jgi:hypothetical protein
VTSWNATESGEGKHEQKKEIMQKDQFEISMCREKSHPPEFELFKEILHGERREQ